MTICAGISWGMALDDVGLPSGLSKVIMHCSLWNDQLSGEFHPNKGIRQGDLMSPYLFAIIMKRLDHMIGEDVKLNCWHSTKLGRQGLAISLPT